jgi:hypothetical protein
MPPLTPRWPLTALLLTLSLGCQAVGPGVASRARPGPVRPSKATPKPSAPASTLAVSQRGAVSTLVGKARLIAHPGGAILSDQGGGVLSDQGGSILSDQGSGSLGNTLR